MMSRQVYQRCVVVALHLVAACGATREVGSQLECGEGTHREGNQCVADTPTGLRCGAGTHASGGECLPDNAYQEKCDMACGIASLPPSGCDAADETACTTECLATTSGLSAECATCVTSRSSIGPGVACITSIECSIAGEVCEERFCVEPDCTCDVTDACDGGCDCDPGCNCVWYVGRVTGDCEAVCQ